MTSLLPNFETVSNAINTTSYAPSLQLLQLMQPPKNDDPNAPDANAILKFLPLMIGYFSLNVPAALGIYWVANNFITTVSAQRDEKRSI